jgi:two-component system sensor histidine kinase AlgZ
MAVRIRKMQNGDYIWLQAAPYNPAMTEPDAPRHFLPDFCAIGMLFAVVISAELLAVVLTLGAAVGLDDFWAELSVRSLFVQWIAIGATAVLCVTKPLLRPLGHATTGLAAWTLVMATASGLSLLALWLDPHLAEPAGTVPFLVRTLGVTAIVAAIVLRYLYEQHCQRQREVAEAQARFAALQARIRPHFLFNSMNTIANLTRADPARAETVVEDLSELFRASLADPSSLSTLGEELELAEGYLRIEAQRLGERLVVDWDLQDLPAAAPVPKLLLQPLLENAVYHGIERAVEGGSITISGRYRRGVVNLAIRNTLPGEQAEPRTGHRIAQANVRDRLAALYGDAAGMVVGRVENDYQVRLHFPYQEQREAAD